MNKYETMTLQELEKLAESIENKMNETNQMQYALKIAMNSIYGAFCNEGFNYFQIDVAESITTEGRGLCQHGEMLLNHYFKNLWHKDFELHKKLNILDTVKPLQNEAVIYCDTDSVHSDTYVNCVGELIRISALFEEMAAKHTKFFYNNNEILWNTSGQMPLILNYSYENGIFESKIKKIIRHKVDKEKWQIISKDGNKIITTNDHSVMVYKPTPPFLFKKKPQEIDIKTDQLISVTGNFSEIVDIKSVECIGRFEDEYVYDIEVEDENHTFFGNNILVHNSNFLSLQEVFDSITNEFETTKEKTEFILKIFEYRLDDFIKKGFDKYAEKKNTVNLQDFELEALFENGILLQKKKYVLNTSWKMPGIFVDSLSSLKIKGVEMVRGNTPIIIANKLTDFIKYILAQGNNLSLNELTKKVKTFKNEYMLADIDEIVFNMGVNDYDKYILDDKKKVQVISACPIHVRACANYNYLLGRNLKHFGDKYKYIQTKDKICWYYVKDNLKDINNVFAYLDGEFPIEFAPSCDKNLMFNKTFLEPLNRFVKAILKKRQIPENLIFQVKLF